MLSAIASDDQRRKFMQMFGNLMIAHVKDSRAALQIYFIEEEHTLK